MAMNHMTQSENVPEENHIVGQARHFLVTELDWISPSATLHSTGSRDFGRSIESSLSEIEKGEVKRLQLRRRDAAVVMSIAHYEEIVRMKEMYAALINRVQEQEIREATDAYDALYQRITSNASKRAADNLFSATGEELGAAYQPGATETK